MRKLVDRGRLLWYALVISEKKLVVDLVSQGGPVTVQLLSDQMAEKLSENVSLPDESAVGCGPLYLKNFRKREVSRQERAELWSWRSRTFRLCVASHPS